MKIKTILSSTVTAIVLFFLLGFVGRLAICLLSTKQITATCIVTAKTFIPAHNVSSGGMGLFHISSSRHVPDMYKVTALHNNRAFSMEIPASSFTGRLEAGDTLTGRFYVSGDWAELHQLFPKKA